MSDMCMNPHCVTPYCKGCEGEFTSALVQEGDADCYHLSRHDNGAWIGIFDPNRPVDGKRADLRLHVTREGIIVSLYAGSEDLEPVREITVGWAEIDELLDDQ